MDKTDQINYWINSATDDLIVVENLFHNNHYSWCLFICHLVIEKSSKALWVDKLSNTPPKIHNLLLLSNKLELLLDKDIGDFFFLMNRFQIEARYPEYKKEIEISTTKEETQKLLFETKRVNSWLKSLLK